MLVITPDDELACKQHCQGIHQSLAPSGHPQVDAALATSRAWGEQKKDLNLLTLYEGRIQRNIDKNYALLERLQQQRHEALQRIVEEAAILGETYDFPAETLPPDLVFPRPQITRLVNHYQRLESVRKPTRRAA